MNKKLFLMLGFLIFCFPFLVDAAEDIENPNMNGLYELSSTSIDTTNESEDVVVTFSASDNLSGVCAKGDDCGAISTIGVYSSLGNQSFLTEIVRSTGDKNSGKYQTNINFPRYAESGSWRMVICLYDKIGNRSCSSFSNVITNNSIIYDSRAPQVIGTPVVTPLSINTETGDVTLNISFNITDDLAGVDDNSDKNYVYFEGLKSFMKRVSGDSLNGYYEATVTVPKYRTFNYETMEIRIGDILDNNTEYDFSYNFTNSGNNFDTVYPVVEGYSISPNEVNVADNSYEIVITFSASDDLSGVCVSADENCHTYVKLGSSNLPAKLVADDVRLISGDSLRGVYQAVVTLPRYAPHGYYSLEIQLEDRTGNNQEDPFSYGGVLWVDDSVMMESDMDDIDIPRPDISFRGKLKDYTLSSSKKIYIKKDKVKFKGNFEDISGGEVVIKYKGSDSGEEIVKVDNNGEWSKNIKFDKEGNYRVKFIFFDSNKREVGSRGYYKIKIDTKDPTIGNLPAMVSKRVGEKVWWSGEDDEEIDEYKYYFNGKKIKTKNSFFNIPQGISRGSYLLEIRAYDRAKNKDVKYMTVNVR